MCRTGGSEDDPMNAIAGVSVATTLRPADRPGPLLAAPDDVKIPMRRVGHVFDLPPVPVDRDLPGAGDRTMSRRAWNKMDGVAAHGRRR
jgi:hypothetical protein